MKKVLFETKFLNLMAAIREGKPDWVYAKRPNAKDVAVIIPVLHRENCLSTIFLLTKRPPLNEEYGENLCVEFPAGLVGDENTDETTEEALYKELLEETGYMAESIEIRASQVVSSGGLTNEKSTLALAHIFDTVEKSSPVDDGGVITKRVEVPIKEIPAFLKDAQSKNYFLSAQMFAGLYYLINL